MSIITVYSHSSLFLAELNLVHLSHLLDKVFLIFPNYCLGMSFSQFYQNYEFIKFCTSSEISEVICKVLSKFYFNRAEVNKKDYENHEFD